MQQDDRQLAELTKEIEMGRYAKDTGGGDFTPAPPGNHVGRCIKIIDLGTQHGEYKGVPNARNQIFIQWELCEENMEDGKPFIVSAFLTNSLSEKATLRHFLEAWRGRSFTAEELKRFDLASILNAPGMVNVIHTEKGKAYVSGVAKLPKSVNAPNAINHPSAFWLDEFDEDVFQALPKGIKAIVEQSDEFKAMKKGIPGGFDQMSDDLPWNDSSSGIDASIPF